MSTMSTGESTVTVAQIATVADTNHMHTPQLSVTAISPVVNTEPTLSTMSNDVLSVVPEAEHFVTTETKAEK